jgi:hypothetical protein
MHHQTSPALARSIIDDRRRLLSRDDVRGSRSPRRSPIWAAAALGVALVLGGVASALAGSDDLVTAKAAAARFNSLGQAAEAGYGPLPAGVPLADCIAAFDGSGAMGFHWLNPALLDTTLEPTAPEVLVYGPDGHGNLKLVALEYVVFAEPWAAEHGSLPPSLFGRTLTFVGEPNRYEVPAFWQVHAWLFESNPAGTFADFNPDVSCS